MLFSLVFHLWLPVVCTGNSDDRRTDKHQVILCLGSCETCFGIWKKNGDQLHIHTSADIFRFLAGEMYLILNPKFQNCRRSLRLRQLGFLTRRLILASCQHLSEYYNLTTFLAMNQSKWIKPQSHIHGFGPGRATVHPDLSNRGASA